MRKIWFYVSHLGSAGIDDARELQSLILTNRVVVVAMLLVLGLGILLTSNQWNEESIFVLSLVVLFTLFLVFTARGYINFSRVALCLSLPVFIVGMSVVSKLIPNELITETEYFDYRYVLLAASLVPPTLLDLSRKQYLFIALSFYFLSFVFFDTIHILAGVGYFQVKPAFQHSLSYFVSGWVATIAFCAISAGLLVMRKTFDEVQAKNIALITELNDVNTVLDKQKAEIKEANDLLTNRITQATKELLESNSELIKHNSELQQFSYTVSHNLRGPVATLLGLVSIAKSSDPELMNNPLLAHIARASKTLDATIKDLGRIVDVRNLIYKIKQKIRFDAIFGEVTEFLITDISEKKIEISTDFKAHTIYTVKPMLASILHNLVSNAIKYTSRERSAKIRITTEELHGTVVLKVRDNGLGIDLKNHGHNLFKLYKRFHLHTEGKGIGLYLVKMQVESLGGKITVESELNRFTEFTVVFPKLQNINRQIVLDEPYGEVFFDATMDVMGIAWHRQVTSQEYRKILNCALELMKEQKPPSWLLDISKRGLIDDEDQAWVLTEVLPTCFKLGLKRLAVVSITELTNSAILFRDKNKEVFEKYGIKVNVFKTSFDAEKWLAKERPDRIVEQASVKV